jgi:Helix-turn-helix domain
MSGMAGRDRRLDRALALFRGLNHEIGHEIGLARGTAGVSQDAAGASVGMSGSQFGRIERGELRNVSVEQWCRASAAVGLRLHIRAYPDGDALRDLPQARLLGRFRGRLHPGVQLRTEVPLYGRTDLRAWDGVIDFADERDAVEAETRIRDGQAMWRRVALKRRDDPTISHVFLLVADTPANRIAIAEIRELLRPDLPLDSRSILSALAKGRCPGAGGILFL